jgi:hypothetical protein
MAGTAAAFPAVFPAVFPVAFPATFPVAFPADCLTTVPVALVPPTSATEAAPRVVVAVALPPLMPLLPPEHADKLRAKRNARRIRAIETRPDQ